jgi:hypothetical protein
MRRAMGMVLFGLPILLFASLLGAQNPTPATESSTDANETDFPPFAIRYEPGKVLPLPIQTCEIQSILSPRPYPFKLPVKVKIYLFDLQQLKPQALFGEETLTEPKKLDPGGYLFEVEGQKEPIHVIYGGEDAWPTYLVYREPAHSLIGPFFIPGIGRLPTGHYSAHGSNFDLSFECRNKERAVFNVPSYEGLPPFLAPAPGVAW